MGEDKGFRELLFPLRCLICGSAGRNLCLTCALGWKLRKEVTHIGQTPIFSSLKYSSSVAKILLASKEDGVRRADALILEALICSAGSAREFVNDAQFFVPIPSSMRSCRRRGRNYMSDISKQLGRSQGIAVRNILFHLRKVSDQSILSAEQRSVNLTGALGVRNAIRIRPPVVLVDDLVTTGSTMKEAVRTLESGGIRVIAGITAFLA